VFRVVTTTDNIHILITTATNNNNSGKMKVHTLCPPFVIRQFGKEKKM
jgi:hypothetical protein